MRIPEKTVLGASAILLSLSSLQVLSRLMDGSITTQMHAAVAKMGSPHGFVLGYIIGFSVVLAVKLFASIGLWALLVKRWRTGDQTARMATPPDRASS